MENSKKKRRERNEKLFLDTCGWTGKSFLRVQHKNYRNNRAIGIDQHVLDDQSDSKFVALMS
jgi:hypothetical protein